MWYGDEQTSAKTRDWRFGWEKWLGKNNECPYQCTFPFLCEEASTVAAIQQKTQVLGIDILERHGIDDHVATTSAQQRGSEITGDCPRRHRLPFGEKLKLATRRARWRQPAIGK